MRARCGSFRHPFTLLGIDTAVQISVWRAGAAKPPCLPLWGRWLSFAKPERVLYPLSQKSKIFASSPIGRAKYCPPGHPGKFQFDLRRNESGRPNGLPAIVGLPGPHCPPGHPGKCQFDCRRNESGGPNGVPMVTGLPGSHCHRALPGKCQFIFPRITEKTRRKARFY